MSITHPWIILFDIDGTLLTVNHSFNRPLIRGILNDLEINYPDMEKDAFSGRTDHDILSSFLVNHDNQEERYQELKSTYLERIDKQITAEDVVRQPHIDEAIEFFHDLGSSVGLLTGNYPSAASAKLRAAKIHYSFSFGAFGEFDKDRNQLPMLAIQHIRDELGIEPNPSRFIIIGDTPRDIQCAKYAGMKSVGVTTGKFSREELAKENADLILDDLSNPDSWFRELNN